MDTTLNERDLGLSLTRLDENWTFQERSQNEQKDYFNSYEPSVDVAEQKSERSPELYSRSIRDDHSRQDEEHDFGKEVHNLNISEIEAELDQLIGNHEKSQQAFEDDVRELLGFALPLKREYFSCLAEKFNLLRTQLESTRAKENSLPQDIQGVMKQ